MADEKKTSEETVAVVQENVRGDRGIVGEASAASALKSQWREAGCPMSLKRWARLQLKDGDQQRRSLAKDWFANKAGAKNEERNDKNKKRVYEEKVASKSARKKAGANKQAKPKTDAAPAA